MTKIGKSQHKSKRVTPGRRLREQAMVDATVIPSAFAIGRFLGRCNPEPSGV
jgi:hypothetical protein